MTELRIDPRDLKPRPCTSCEGVISEVLSDFNEEADYTYIESTLKEFDDVR